MKGCALDADCDVIVTNNPDDYKDFSELPIMTSEEFVLACLLEGTGEQVP